MRCCSQITGSIGQPILCLAGTALDTHVVNYAVSLLLFVCVCAKIPSVKCFVRAVVTDCLTDHYQAYTVLLSCSEGLAL